MTTNDLNDLANLVTAVHHIELALTCDIQDDDGRTFDEMTAKNRAKFAHGAASLLNDLLDELLAAREVINKALTTN